MKNVKWFGISVASALLLCAQAQTLLGQVPAAAGGTPAVSPAAGEVVKLASSGVGDEVVLAYIRNSQGPFDLNADQLLYLKDVGLSPQVITAMLDHDNAMHSQAPPPGQQFAPAPQPAPAPEAPAPQPMPAAAAAPAAPAPTYVSNPPLDVGYFYNDLSPYGTWVDLAGVGWCWQPSTVVTTVGWRPYCHGGHWVWTEAGWFWQSDYTWGWAPFHYGRWFVDAHCGWVWVPGTTWGPAWVTWRSTGDVCGWAPLPPHADFVAGVGWRFNGVSVGVGFDFGLSVNAFAFVSVGNMCSANVWNACLPRERVNVIYKQTTVINNYVVNNNTFINRGIAYDRVVAASHTPVPHASIRDVPPGKALPGGAGSFVYRAPLHEPPKSVHMVAQKVDIGHNIQHTSFNAMKYDQKSSFGTGGPATTSYFQHNQNATVKGQSNPAFGTPNASKTPTGVTRNFQSSTWEKNGTSLQNTPGSKSFQQNQSVTGAKNTHTFGNEALAGQGSQNAANLHSKDQSQLQKAAFGTPGQNGPTAGQNYRYYTPKTIDQASEVHALPKTDQHPANSYTPSSSGLQQQQQLKNSGTGFQQQQFKNSGSQLKKNE